MSSVSHVAATGNVFMNRDVFITENEFAAFSNGTNWNRVWFFAGEKNSFQLRPCATPPHLASIWGGAWHRVALK